MNKTLLTNIVDMTRWASSAGYFSQTYTFDNGTELWVSRNPMTGGYASGLLAALPVDASGRQLDERADAWLTALEVAQKMEILASE